MGAAAYLEPVFNIIRHLTNGFNLFQKRMRIYDYPVPDNTGGIPIKNTGRYEVKYNLFIIKFKSMSGICASLIPDHKIGSFAKQVKDLPFSLLALFGAHTHRCT